MISLTKLKRGHRCSVESVSTAAPSPSCGDVGSPWHDSPSPTFSQWSQCSPRKSRHVDFAIMDAPTEGAFETMGLTPPLDFFDSLDNDDALWAKSDEIFLDTSDLFGSKASLDLMAGFSEPPPVGSVSRLSLYPPICEESDFPPWASSTWGQAHSRPEPIPEIPVLHETRSLPLPTIQALASCAVLEDDGARTPPAKTAIAPHCLVTPAPRRTPASPPSTPRFATLCPLM